MSQHGAHRLVIPLATLLIVLSSGLANRKPPAWAAEEPATPPRLVVLFGHQFHVGAVSFSPDGKHVLSACSDRTAKLWETVSGREIRVFRGHTAMVETAAFSPNGQQILTGSMDHTARLWDVATGKEIRKYEGDPTAVLAVAFSPNGKQFAMGRNDSTARLWDVQNGKEIRKFVGHEKAVVAVAISSDGKYLLTGSEDSTARIWELTSGNEVRRFDMPADGAEDAINARRVPGRPIPETPKRERPVKAVAFSSDAKLVLTGNRIERHGGHSAAARLWDVASGKEVRTFAVPDG